MIYLIPDNAHSIVVGEYRLDGLALNVRRVTLDVMTEEGKQRTDLGDQPDTQRLKLHEQLAAEGWRVHKRWKETHERKASITEYRKK
jgi:hypothetical protein